MHKILSLTAMAMLALPAAAWCHPQDQQQGQSQSQTSAQASQAPPASKSATAPAPQQDSLAEAARKAREQKKDATKPAKVFTNDNLPTMGGISTVGAESTTESAAPSDNKSAAGNEEKSWRDKFAQLRHKLDQDQAEEAVMQRELGVLNLQYYNDPVKAMQQELTRDDINKKTAAIDAKKKDIEADQQAIADAEDDLRKAGGDSGWSR